MRFFSNIWNVGLFWKLVVPILLLCTCSFCVLLVFPSDKEQVVSKARQGEIEETQSSQETGNGSSTQEPTATSIVVTDDDEIFDLSVPEEATSVSTARTLVIMAFYVLLGILFLGFLYLAFQTFRGRPTWGQARYMGIPFSLFVWIQVIFYLVVFEGVYDIAGLILQTPLWLDCLISSTIFIVPLIVFLKVRDRSTFKPKLFIPLILVPLGIPAINVVADLTQAGAVKITRLGVITIVKNGDELQGQIIKNTIGGSVKFANTHDIGRLGDRLTAIKLTALGYKKLPSKYTQIHGIDGIYILRDSDEEIKELILVENKVDAGKLAPGTMSDEWVIERVNKMMASDYQEVAETGQLISEFIEKNPLVIKRQLWHHHLESGTITVKEIGANGVIVAGSDTVWEDNFTKNQIQHWCELGSLTCLPTQ
ncbi:MAG: hypothetical protein Kow0031_10580 [Anaerolineae bacterium]